MSAKPKSSRRLWPYLAVPALAVVVAATMFLGDFTAADDPADAGRGGSELPGSQLNESELGTDLQPDPTELHEQAQDQLQDQLDAAVEDYLSEIDNENLYVSLAVSDEEFTLDHEGEALHDTASIVKAEILAMLLLHYDSVEDIPDWAMYDLEKMIKDSDNDATNSILFGVLDGHETMREAHEVLGLDQTRPDETERWGLTETTALDQLTVLEQVLYEGLLSAEQVEVSRELMGDLADSQDWGVSAAAEDGETVWMKNGWDTRSNMGGEWVVNSIGVIAGETDEPISISILTGGLPSHQAGIDMVEDLAQIAREVIDTDPYA
ncbi:serine hydrolase [Glycomyces salinus]|uniref:serine hydrolase n=1 Tax=Glycomyces salinus TaxID=980294 RepID=UPI0018ECD5EA|nr:serine hydrolase [Glycomyces salinus]